MPYPVVVVDATYGQQEVDRLAPVETLREAKAAARAAGYSVIDSGPGGDCETTDAWHGGKTVHLIAVKRV